MDNGFYEAWRDALAAFYERECSFQSAANLRAGYPLTGFDKLQIEALEAAFDHAPRRKMKLAA